MSDFNENPFGTDRLERQTDNDPDKTMRTDGVSLLEPIQPGKRRSTMKSRRGKGNLHEEEKKLQATAMLARRVLLSESQALIAKQFGVSPNTVASRLQLARQQDLIGLARDVIGQNLLPKAIAVYDMHLNEGSLEAARDVLFGSSVLQKTSKAEITHSPTPTLDMVREERMRKSVDAEFSSTPEAGILKKDGKDNIKYFGENPQSEYSGVEQDRDNNRGEPGNSEYPPDSDREKD